MILWDIPLSFLPKFLKAGVSHGPEAIENEGQ